MRQDTTKEDLMLLIDKLGDEILSDYVNAKSGGATRARAMVVIELTRLFEQVETSKMRPVREIEGVAV